MKKCVIYNPFSNHTVTDTYVGLVEQSINDCGIETQRVDRLNNAEKGTGAFVVYMNDAYIARRKGYSPVILWVQGVSPEESYMRNGSKLRMAVLSYMERRGLLAADALILVSEAMCDHFREKYRKEFAKSYIMPCFNDEIDKSAFFTPNKYSDNVFLYAGGLQVWQCFDRTMRMYAEIENRVKNCSLRVLTRDGDKAKEIINGLKIKNYSVGYVKSEDIGSEMSKAKFGFSLRDDTPVNRVATPTKLSTYVAYGVMPIYSKYLLGFGSVANQNPYCIQVDEQNGNTIENIVSFCNQNVDPHDVYESYLTTFVNYYSTKYHKENLSNYINEINVVK